MRSPSPTPLTNDLEERRLKKADEEARKKKEAEEQEVSTNRFPSEKKLVRTEVV